VHGAEPAGGALAPIEVPRPHVPIADPAIAAELAARLGDEELPEDLLAPREIHDQLLLALTALRGDVQDLIIDHYFRGLSHEALAGRLGVGVRAVEGRLYRARQMLRERLARLDPEEI
jgi:RNA polymerase sigma-70 factor (ECF subfamily)